MSVTLVDLQSLQNIPRILLRNEPFSTRFSPSRRFTENVFRDWFWFFELLSKKSILASSVEENTEFELPKNREIFEQAVRQGAESNLLHASFGVRTNELFGKADKKENLHYLSGLLIGAELKELGQLKSAKIFLCCSSNLKSRYEAAFSTLGIHALKIFPAAWVDRAVVRGQIQIYHQAQKS